MRFNACARKLKWSAVLVLAGLSYIETAAQKSDIQAAAEKSCECGNPSIGTVTCEQNAEPYCLVDASKIKAGCKSSGGRKGKDLQRFIIEQALGRSLTDVEWKSSDVQNGIKDGAVEVRSPDGKMVWVNVRSGTGFDGPFNEETPLPTSRPLGGGGVAAGNNYQACEVCISDALGTHCKNIRLTKEADLKTAVSELCGSNSQCLMQKPKVTCKSPPVRQPER